MADEGSAAPAGAAAAAPAATGAPAPASAPASAAPAAAPAGAAPAAAAPAPADPKPTPAAAKPADAKPADKPVEPSFPENWRELMAGGDAKKLENLKRYASPQAVLDAHLQLRGKLSSGELKGPFPKDGKPEAQAAWRKENGVPETAEAYDITLPDGLVVGEEDLPIVNEVRKAMHEVNAPQAVMTKALTAYYKMRAAEESAQNDRDLEHKSQAEESLRQEWGVEYKQNVNAIANFMRATFGGDADRLLGARLADGKPLGNDPAILRALAGVVREINPIHSVVGHNGPDAMKSVETEIAEIEKSMRTDRAAYFKDTAKQDRYQQLIAARDKQKARAA